MNTYTIRKGELTTPLLIHIPHSSTFIPSSVLQTFLIRGREVEEELLVLTDWYVDQLFSGIQDVGGVLMRYDFSRLVVDPERFEDDTLESMAEKGLGVIYAKTSTGKALRETLSGSERETLLESYYRPFHQGLEGEVQNLLNLFGRCLIVDGHSFSSTPLPFEPDQDPIRPGICVGTDSFHTPATLVTRAENYFKRAGFMTALNRPYSGTMVPLQYLGKDERVSSVMIEINRKLYLDERTGEKSGSFDRLRDVISGLLRTILEA
jgi:N-formylglutamate deformylase